MAAASIASAPSLAVFVPSGPRMSNAAMDALPSVGRDFHRASGVLRAQALRRRNNRMRSKGSLPQRNLF
jgi:hypothetical protein